MNPSPHHNHNLNSNQCSSTMVKTVRAPLPVVWSLLRRFDQPQAYKTLVKRCTMLVGSGGVGSVRELAMVSGLPGNLSTERLERLDDDPCVMVYSTIGGDQRLDNYRSTTTAHEAADGGGTVVVESYVVDVPEGNNEEETLTVANTFLRCHLSSLARVSERLAK